MGRVKWRPKYVTADRQDFKPDPDEEAALTRAFDVFREVRLADPEFAVYGVISAWILERTLRATAKQEAVGLNYDLDDTHLRGVATAILSQVGERIAACGVASDVPFFELSRDDVVTVLVEAFLYMQAAVKMADAAPFPETIAAPKPDKRAIDWDKGDQVPF